MITESNEDDDGKTKQILDDSISGSDGELLDAAVVGHLPHVC